MDKEDFWEDYGKNKYKLHYIYREFTVDFFRMDINSLPKGASSLKFTKHRAHVMSLCLTLRKTSQALKDLYGIRISHQQVANYCRTAAMCVRPFVDRYDYQTGSTFTADETYIKVRGVKGYVWLIMDAAKRSIIGYQASDNRGVGPCILAMRMAFRSLKNCRKTSGLLPVDTVHTRLLHSSFTMNAAMVINLRLPRSQALQTMVQSPQNSVHTNR